MTKRVKYMAKAVIPTREKQDLDPANVVGQISKGEVVTVTSTNVVDGVEYGRVRKGLYVVLSKNGVDNFEKVDVQ